MGEATVLKIIKKFRRALESQHIRIGQIVLYGSWAKGKANKDSDIDLVVISKDFEGKNYWERIDVLTEAIYPVFAPIEATALTPKEWKHKKSLICQFAKDGKSV